MRMKNCLLLLCIVGILSSTSCNKKEEEVEIKEQETTQIVTEIIEDTTSIEESIDYIPEEYNIVEESKPNGFEVVPNKESENPFNEVFVEDADISFVNDILNNAYMSWTVDQIKASIHKYIEGVDTTDMTLYYNYNNNAYDFCYSDNKDIHFMLIDNKLYSMNIYDETYTVSDYNDKEEIINLCNNLLYVLSCEPESAEVVILFDRDIIRVTANDISGNKVYIYFSSRGELCYYVDFVDDNINNIYSFSDLMVGSDLYTIELPEYYIEVDNIE